MHGTDAQAEFVRPPTDVTRRSRPWARPAVAACRFARRPGRPHHARSQRGDRRALGGDVGGSSSGIAVARASGRFLLTAAARSPAGARGSSRQARCAIAQADAIGLVGGPARRPGLAHAGRARLPFQAGRLVPSLVRSRCSSPNRRGVVLRRLSTPSTSGRHRSSPSPATSSRSPAARAVVRLHVVPPTLGVGFCLACSGDDGRRRRAPRSRRTPCRPPTWI